MAYIGRQNLGGAYRQLDDISSSFNSSNTAFTMQVSSTNVSLGDVNQIVLSLGGVIQKPGTDFTISGSTLTFTTAPAANTSFFAILLGSDNGGTVTPTDASVTVDKLAIAGGEVKLDADGDTSITADTDDQIDFKVGGTDQIKLTDGILAPTTTNDVDLGSTSLRFKDVAISNDIVHLDNAGTGRTLYDRSENLLGNAGTNFYGYSIYLGGTGDANRLEDYEEGTWTAALSGTGSSSGQSYDNATMQYTKIGRIVYITGTLDLSSKGTLGGDFIKITGLPFAPDNSNSNSYQPIKTIHFNVAGGTSGSHKVWAVYGANSFMYVFQDTHGGASQMTPSNYENTTIVGCSGAYVTAL
tara:strand:- start:358 stop:1422 length:1065 start_codon:yes stop_codon:yes gene_type:complete